MKLLILGGTKFLGRHLVEAALKEGHDVTLFNRGLTEPGLLPDVERLRGDRGGDLESLKGRRWDAVVDTCGYVSSEARAAAQLLADSVEHYTFISSLSVYVDFSRPGLDESGAVKVLDEGKEEDAGDVQTYGARKALCERAAEEMMPGRVLNARAGMIVGPHDYIDRFPYWVLRVARGGEVLAPAPPFRPVQLIDARDLAAWNLRMITERRTGVFNVTGPGDVLTMGQMLSTCREVSGSDASLIWVDEQFLLRAGVKAWSELPFWWPGDEAAGFFSVDRRKAIRAGLKFRPLHEKVEDTLSWLKTRDPLEAGPKRAMVMAQGQIGLLPERERELLGMWREENRP